MKRVTHSKNAAFDGKKFPVGTKRKTYTFSTGTAPVIETMIPTRLGLTIPTKLTRMGEIIQRKKVDMRMVTTSMRTKIYQGIYNGTERLL